MKSAKGWAESLHKIDLLSYTIAVLLIFLTGGNNYCVNTQSPKPFEQAMVSGAKETHPFSNLKILPNTECRKLWVKANGPGMCNLIFLPL